MNNKRRKQIESIISRLEDLKVEITEVLEDETEYLENIPENLCQSERYEKSDNAIDNITNSETSIDECIESLQESII